MTAMRPTRLTTKMTASALGLVLGAAALTMAGPARAADDDTPIDTKIIRSILEGIGLRKDGDGINYQERAPLVIPPGKDLPPPEKSAAAVANDPSWPVDPDVKRSKEEAALERNKSQNPDDAILNDQRVLRPSEITPGARSSRAARRVGTTDSNAASTYGNGNPLPPSQLGVKGSGGIFGGIFGKSDDAEAAKFTGEPPRASLTEPPPGYQTPSPDQPYGVGKAKAVAPKPGDYLMNHPVGDAQ